MESDVKIANAAWRADQSIVLSFAPNMLEEFLQENWEGFQMLDEQCNSQLIDIAMAVRAQNQGAAAHFGLKLLREALMLEGAIYPYAQKSMQVDPACAMRAWGNNKAIARFFGAQSS